MTTRKLSAVVKELEALVLQVKNARYDDKINEEWRKLGLHHLIMGVGLLEVLPDTKVDKPEV